MGPGVLIAQMRRSRRPPRRLGRQQGRAAPAPLGAISHRPVGEPHTGPLAGSRLPSKAGRQVWKASHEVHAEMFGRAGSKNSVIADAPAPDERGRGGLTVGVARRVVSPLG